MNEEIKAFSETERVDPETVKKDLRRTYSRCGWILLAYVVLSMAISFLIDSFLALESDAVKAFFEKYLLFVNAIVIGGATLGAALFLKFIPKSAPERRKTTPKDFIKYVFIAFGASSIGNFITRFCINFLYFVTGIEISDRVSAAVGSVAPWQSFVCVVLIAPITEEFLFRKLIIDRLYKHGEYLAILTSAIFFGLYHQNVYQLLPTLGTGLILGYLYCKTGSYLAVTLMHMIYNFVGVIPLFFNYTPAGYLAYMIVVAAINIFGIVLLIKNRNKFGTENNAPALLESDKREIVIRAPGIVAAAVAMILLTVRSLFL